MTSSDFDKITPAEIDLKAPRTPPDVESRSAGTAPLGTGEDDNLRAYQQRNARILWGILLALLVVAGAVFFVLPSVVSPPELSTRPQSTPAPDPTPATGPQVSPFEEAQRARQREAAQDALAGLLELQSELEDRGVEQWAQAQYEQALVLATEADAAYREQDFVEASSLYQRGLDIFRQLDNDLPTVLAGLLAEGNLALEQGDAAAAAAAFELAMVLEPASQEADAGLQRAQVLDDVLALYNEARIRSEAGELEAARDLYQQALALDPEHQASQEALAGLRDAIVERNFSQLMSRGYGALQADRPEDAEGFFEQALNVRPGSQEATTALEQVRDQISSAAIAGHLNAARQHADQEQWQAALTEYENALAVDPNVVAALDGRNRARSRLNLDNFLESLLADPLTLADDAIYEQSRDVYTNALRIAGAGPRLRDQLEQARFYLEEARVPRSVTFTSDGTTTVNLLRVESLGQFTRNSLELTPGHYVATGVKQGYRDVRIEFTVPFEGEAPVVEVISNQSIR